MDEWSYIRAAYGLTWVTLGGYAIYLVRRMLAAERSARMAPPPRPEEHRS